MNPTIDATARRLLVFSWIRMNRSIRLMREPFGPDHSYQRNTPNDGPSAGS
jgi:hypothetical protein